MSDAQNNAAKAWEQWMKMWGQSPQNTPPQMNEAIAQWQAMMKDSFEQFAQNEAFLTAMGKQMANSFKLKETVDEAIEKQLHAMRMPTTTDVTGLRKRLRQLDDRIEDLSEAIEDHLGEGATGPAEAMNQLKAATEAAARAADAATRAAGAALEAAAVLEKAAAALEAASAEPAPEKKAPSTKKTSSKKKTSK